MVTDIDKKILDGILACASDNNLSLVKAIKRETGEMVTILCCNFSKDRRHVVNIPLAEIIVGQDFTEMYIFDDAGAVEISPSIEAGIAGYDKPLDS